MLDAALSYVTKSQVQMLATQIVKVRAADTVSHVRAVLLNEIGEWDSSQLKVACETSKQAQLVALVAKMCEDSEVGKVALFNFLKVVQAAQNTSSKEVLKQLAQSFDSCKSALLSRILPSTENQNDPQSMIKAIQILSHFQDKIASDTHAMIANNVHHGSADVRKEAANFLLTTQSELKNGLSDLLPI